MAEKRREGGDIIWVVSKIVLYFALRLFTTLESYRQHLQHV